jgi:hypothetical protein
MRHTYVRKLVLPPSAAALALAAGSCCCLCGDEDDVVVGGTTCVEFEDPSGTFQVGGTFVDNGVQVTVGDFQWSGGTTAPNGWVSIDATNHALGTGNAGHTNNATFDFAFGPCSQVTLQLGELGGTNNMVVNGELRNFSNFSDVDNATIGGCTVDFQQTGASGNNYYGTLSISGSIQSFEIGGQELWIDHVCATSGG